jgi:hypothetical protein
LRAAEGTEKHTDEQSQDSPLKRHGNAQPILLIVRGARPGRRVRNAKTRKGNQLNASISCSNALLIEMQKIFRSCLENRQRGKNEAGEPKWGEAL